ncbi:MAG: TIGR00159 family protein [Akkermansiaceae bacterium]|nr:TIGR00159 family protein [Armatimonadota bacterium]
MPPVTNFWHILQTLPYLAILRAGFDITLVAYLLYRLILLAKGRRAWQIILGIGVFFAFLIASEKLGLIELNWLLTQVTPLGPVAIVILLYPELRDILEKLGRLDFWGAPIHVTAREDVSLTVEKVVRAAVVLSGTKTGALIVLERETGLDDIIITGTPLDCEVSQPLLSTIFYDGTPLHDGAAIIRGNRIAAAGCRLPTTESPNVGTNVHMRHRAAIGMSENSDAITVVVSEERGTISLTSNGKLVPGLSEATLRQRLQEAFGIAAPKKTILTSALHLPENLPFGRRKTVKISPPKGDGTETSVGPSKGAKDSPLQTPPLTEQGGQTR